MANLRAINVTPHVDKLTVTVERIDGGKLRCTGATWLDAVVIYQGGGAGPCEHRAPSAGPPGPKAPAGVVQTPPADTPDLVRMISRPLTTGSA